MDPIQGNVGRLAGFAGSPCTEPYGDSKRECLGLLITASLFHYSLAGLMNSNPISEVDILEAYLLRENLKSRGTKYGVQTLQSLRKSLDWWFCSDCVALCWW